MWPLYNGWIVSFWYFTKGGENSGISFHGIHDFQGPVHRMFLKLWCLGPCVRRPINGTVSVPCDLRCSLHVLTPLQQFQRYTLECIISHHLATNSEMDWEWLKAGNTSILSHLSKIYPVYHMRTHSRCRLGTVKFYVKASA